MEFGIDDGGRVDSFIAGLASVLQFLGIAGLLGVAPLAQGIEHLIRGVADLLVGSIGLGLACRFVAAALLFRFALLALEFGALVGDALGFGSLAFPLGGQQSFLLCTLGAHLGFFGGQTLAG
ncbi:MAG TPA: hypothetical protein DD502_33730, partial [Cupriavidus sp.]|nr:hypothetical protein [Cupriavidus sp.]